MAGDIDTFGAFALDRKREVLTRNGEAISIGHRGYVLLRTLLDAAGETVGKDALMNAVWPGMIVEEANVSVQIAALRKALGHDGENLIITVPRIGYRLIRPDRSRAPATGGEVEVRAAAIAVLPFANLSEDQEQDYLADGLVEEIITALSRFKQFAVAARNSSFVFKGRTIDVREAAKALGVRYVLEGGVRRSGDRLRVTAQLVDGSSGAQLWADKFEGQRSDIFAFQDQITEQVVGLIEPEVRRAEIERARRKPAQSLEAYDLFLRALPLVYGMDTVGYVEAIGLLERAWELDRSFGLAAVFAAWSVEKLLTRDVWSDDEAGARAVSLARAAHEVSRDDPLVSAIAGWVLYNVGLERSGLEMLRRGIEANPNNLIALNLGGVANLIDRDYDAASDCYRRALRISPNAPDAFWSLTGEGWVQLERRNFETALEWFGRSLATGNEWPFTYFGIIAAYAHLGRMDEAKANLKRLQTIAPGTTMNARPLRDEGTLEALPVQREGLRMAGLPEA